MERTAQHGQRLAGWLPGTALSAVLGGEAGAGLAATAWVLVLALGLAVGSFLNVVIWRVPQGLSVVRPPSACPRCGGSIRARDNVPVLSWLVLRGRCRDCHEPINLRYPAVELATGLVFVGVVWRFLDEPTLAAVPAYWYVGAIGVALALIDVDTHRLPDAIVKPSYAVLAVLLCLATWASGEPDALLRACIGAGGLFLVYFLPTLVVPGSMGWGDVKLSGVLGAALAWLGWGTLAVGGFAAFLLGGAYAVVLLVSRRARRRSRLPFGPWMVLGAFVGVAVGEQAWAAYLGLAS